MGVERTVTLWYLHRQMLLSELASLEAQLEAQLVQIPTALSSEEAPPEAKDGAESVEIDRQYKRVQERLRSLGPCPRPMMG
jgi:hypothetical protein